MMEIVFFVCRVQTILLLLARISNEAANKSTTLAFRDNRLKELKVVLPMTETSGNSRKQSENCSADHYPDDATKLCHMCKDCQQQVSSNCKIYCADYLSSVSVTVIAAAGVAPSSMSLMLITAATMVVALITVSVAVGAVYHRAKSNTRHLPENDALLPNPQKQNDANVHLAVQDGPRDGSESSEDQFSSSGDPSIQHPNPASFTPNYTRTDIHCESLIVPVYESTCDDASSTNQCHSLFHVDILVKENNAIAEVRESKYIHRESLMIPVCESLCEDARNTNHCHFSFDDDTLQKENNAIAGACESNYQLGSSEKVAVERSLGHAAPNGFNVIDEPYGSTESGYQLKESNSGDFGMASPEDEIGLQSDSIDRHQNSGILRHSITTASLDSNTRMRIFGWLNGQDWVLQYFDTPGEISIVIEGVEKSVAEEMIRAAGVEISNVAFRIVERQNGRYVPCPNNAGGGGFNLVDDGILVPNLEIYSPQQEPDTPGERPQPGYALYSGAISGSGFPLRGLTVGHLFLSENIGCESHRRRESLEGGVSLTEIGKCVRKLDEVRIEARSLGRMTADLAFIKLDVRFSAMNVVRIGGMPYHLRLDKGSVAVPMPVIIIDRHGVNHLGVIVDKYFTMKNLRLFNTLSIVSDGFRSSKVTSEGDSGALVLSRPAAGSSVLYVYGMVIGFYESDDGSTSSTVATRLWNILEADCRGGEFENDLDFPLPISPSSRVTLAADSSVCVDSGFTSGGDTQSFT